MTHNVHLLQFILFLILQTCLQRVPKTISTPAISTSTSRVNIFIETGGQGVFEEI